MKGNKNPSPGCNCGTISKVLGLGAWFLYTFKSRNPLLRELMIVFARNAYCDCDPCNCKPKPSLPTPPSHYPWPPASSLPLLHYPSSHYPWGGAGAAPARRDPLVLDLNRDGKVELKNAAYFDLNANGFHEFTRWIDKTDAFLVLDKNFNGKADDGGELFGDAMTLPDGSVALTGFEGIDEGRSLRGI